MKRQVKHLLKMMLKIGTRRGDLQPDRAVVSLKTDLPSQGNVLLAYIIDPFLLARGENINIGHTHHFESTLLAQSYLDLGYDVDVISYLNKDFLPRKDYAIYLNARENFVLLSRRLNQDCIKIVHLDTAHFLFNNFAAYKRLLDVQRRRGATVEVRVICAANRAIENCDYATILGNEFTISTYSYCNKLIFPLPIPTPFLPPAPTDKNYHACRKNFLWFGSRGLVHKGLDLVLEAFSQLPEFNLTVCGPLTLEPLFLQTYHKELYETPNIKAVGWVDVTSSDFSDITRNCIGLIYPSCAEGQSGAVITCMQAGLIPVISYESGVDVDDYGILLEESSIEHIIKAVTALSQRTELELHDMAEKCVAYCRLKHVGENYLHENKKIINQILSMHAAE